MGKLILALIVAIGAWYLTTTYLPSTWTHGPGFLSYQGFRVPWAIFLVGGAVFLVYKRK